MAKLTQYQCAVKANELFQTYFGPNKLGTEDPNFYSDLQRLEYVVESELPAITKDNPNRVTISKHKVAQIDIDDQIEILNTLENNIVINRNLGGKNRPIYATVDQNIRSQQLKGLDNFRTENELFENQNLGQQKQGSASVNQLRRDAGLPTRLENALEIDGAELTSKIAERLYNSYFGDKGTGVNKDFIAILRSECGHQSEKELEVIEHITNKIVNNEDGKYRQGYKRDRISSFMRHEDSHQDGKHHRLTSFFKQGQFKHQDKQLDALQGLKEHIETSAQRASNKNTF